MTAQRHSPNTKDANPCSSARPSLVSSGIHTVAVNVVAIPIGVLGSVMLARFLGPTGKGTYDLVLATSSLLVMILSLQLYPGITFAIAQNRAAIGSLSAVVAVLAVAQSAVGILILIVFGRSTAFAAMVPTEIGEQFVFVISITVLGTLLAGYGRSFLYGLERFHVANWIDLASRTATVAAIGVFWILSTIYPGRVSISILIFANASFLVSSFLLTLIFLGKWRALKRGRTDLGLVFRFAIPNYLGDLVQHLNYRLDIFIVSHFVGARGVGLYVIAIGLAQLVWMVSQSAAKVLFPRIASAPVNSTANQTMTSRAARLILWLNIGMAICIGVVSPFLLPLVYGEAFMDSVRPVLFLLPGVVAFGIVNVLAAYIAGSGRPRLNLYIAIAGLIATISLNLILVPKIGISGAAIASSASYSLSCCLTMWVFVRLTRTPYAELLIPTSTDCRDLAATIRSVVLGR